MEQVPMMIKSGYFKLLFALLIMFSGCQKEFTDIQGPDSGETINRNDNVFALILNVTLKDGSFDNAIDKCNEISIKFPYTIQVDGQSLLISSLQDINNLALTDSTDVAIVFPVTVVFSDYTEKTLYDESELDTIQEQFREIVEDDDNECVDFVYPIELILYNTTYQKSDIVKVMNDRSMFDIFNQLSESIVAIRYPINLMTLDGSSFEINTKEELEAAIANTVGECDEEDVFDIDEGGESDVQDENIVDTDTESVEMPAESDVEN